MRYYQFCIRTKVQEASGVGGGGVSDTGIGLS